MSKEYPLTPAGIEPAAFRFVAQHLNHCATELSSSIFCFLQGKAQKEIHAILIETLACFLPGRAKDLSAVGAKLSRLSCFTGQTPVCYGTRVNWTNRMS